MENKVLWVINPLSGGEDKTNLSKLIHKRMEEADVEFDLFYTTGVDDEEKIDKLIKRFGPSKIGVAGGDGTINSVLKHVMNYDIPLGIIPYGSANGLATELEIPMNTDKAISRVLDGDIKEVDLISVDEQHLAIHLCDLGLNARIVQGADESSWRGMVSYAVAFIKKAPTQEPFSVFVKAGEKEINANAYMVVIANARKFGTGAVINPKGNMSDGKVEVCIIKKFMMKNLINMFSSPEDYDLEGMEIISGTEFMITTDPETPFQVDGEFMGSKSKLHVVSKPSAVKLLV